MKEEKKYIQNSERRKELTFQIIHYAYRIQKFVKLYTIHAEFRKSHSKLYTIHYTLQKKKINREFRNATLYSVAQINDDPINTYRIQKATQRQKSLYNQLFKKKKNSLCNQNSEKAIQVQNIKRKKEKRSHVPGQGVSLFRSRSQKKQYWSINTNSIGLSFFFKSMLWIVYCFLT